LPNYFGLVIKLVSYHTVSEILFVNYELHDLELPYGVYNEIENWTE